MTVLAVAVVRRPGLDGISVLVVFTDVDSDMRGWSTNTDPGERKQQPALNGIVVRAALERVTQSKLPQGCPALLWSDFERVLEFLKLQGNTQRLPTAELRKNRFRALRYDDGTQSPIRCGVQEDRSESLLRPGRCGHK